MSGRRLASRLTWLVLLVGLVMLCGLRPAGAQMSPTPKHFPHAPPTPPPSTAGPGKIRITAPDGGDGPVPLTPKSGGFVGEFVVYNDGPGPLTVTRLAVRTDDDDPRLPPRFNARFADGGGGSGIISSHSSKRVNITWIPDREPKLHQALGLVVLTSTDESAPEVAMGFVAPMPGLVQGHLLSLMLFAPLLGAVVALAMLVVGYAEVERLRGLFVGLTGIQCFLAALLYQGFNGAVTRLDGNDGFQFVERSVLVRPWGVEFFVGVDGLSVTLVLLCSLLGLVAAVMSAGLPRFGSPRELSVYYCLLGLLLVSLMGLLVSLDLAVFASFWVLMTVVAVALLARSGGELVRARAAPLAAIGALGSGCLVFGVMMLHFEADTSYLVDGTRAPHAFAVSELMRVAYNAKHLELLGLSWVKVVWGALFVAFASVPILLCHAWRNGAPMSTPPPVQMLLAAVGLKAGLYGLLRVSVGILPDGSRWAATTLALAGVVTIAFGALSLWRSQALSDIIGSVIVGELGFCFLGVGAMTREGFAGCLFQMVSHGLLVGVVFVVSGAAGAPATATDAPRVSSSATVWGIALGALVGMPGLPGFWGEIVPILGAFPVARALAVLALLGALATVVLQVRALRTVPMPTLALRGRDIAAILPLALFAIALGLCPGPFFTLVQGGVSDTNQLVNPPGPDEIALAN